MGFGYNLYGGIIIQLKFKYQWRPEQQRVLDNVLPYLDDKRIHLVAAPGAGKTVIGIEIFNRLQLKTLVVSPTRLIRNQWLSRLGDFISDGSKPTWCSKSLHETQFFTSTTYQGLFSLEKKLAENPDQNYQNISQWFAKNEIKLLVLDEAHHLKAAWWKVLMQFVHTDSQLIIVSLTATPPYDASALEWSRYQQLCGLVDEHISIPELVKSNSLCPHQDYIWMVSTDEKNMTSLKRHQQNLAHFIQSLQQHAELVYLLQLHDWLQDYQEIHHKEILYHLDECFALLGLLKLLNKEIPNYLLDLLALKVEEIEPITVFGWEVLLQSFLQGEHYPQVQVIETFKTTLATLLSSKHFLRKGKVSLDNTRRKLQAFNKTQERIKACYEIAKVEYQNRKQWMRLVILSDFIRDEKYQLSLSGLEAPTGAYPIFHYFIHHQTPALANKTVLLTGRLVIIPKTIINDVANSLPTAKPLELKEYSEHKEFIEVLNSTDELTFALTKLQQKGKILTLIGTRSLLGEGWDAPHVNALIMATQTGAFVTTNQLRGRAIRIDTNDDLKTASIWHIIALASDSAYNQVIFKDLHRRFATFAGIHANELRIESGIERLLLTNELNDEHSIISQSNKAMIKRHADGVYNLQARWQNALGTGKQALLKTGLQVEIKNKAKTNNLTRFISKITSMENKTSTKKYLKTYISVTLFSLVLAAVNLLTGKYVLLMGFVAIGILSLKKRITGRSLLQNKSHYYSTLLAKTVLATLHDNKQLKTIRKERGTHIVVSKLEKGYYRYSLAGYTHKENELFLTALSQLLQKIERPRYLISLVKKPSIDDIFPVPNMFAINKKTAQLFLNNWRKHVKIFKHSHLIAANSKLGVQLLLKVRAHYYSQQDEDEIQLIDRWE